MKNLEQERLMILKMVEDGKISADDAVKLISALKAEQKYDMPDMDEKLNKFSQAVDSFAKEFGEKFGSVTKEVEPRLKKATKVVVEKTAAVIDDIAKSLNETLKNFEEEKEECCQGCDEAEDVADVEAAEEVPADDDQPKEN